ncbi:hypothetical protein E2C01_020361 [Portunus trituberculatus]|uniref:Uncharacterized protein n=1 Tax=Portunus trituberculatus TaxID=210409 RepID=A0A5B7E224_PORTR|nr:hypothetical protein [Portunus trituberculatus]
MLSLPGQEGGSTLPSTPVHGRGGTLDLITVGGGVNAPFYRGQQAHMQDLAITVLTRFGTDGDAGGQVNASHLEQSWRGGGQGKEWRGRYHHKAATLLPTPPTPALLPHLYFHIAAPRHHPQQIPVSNIL